MCIHYILFLKRSAQILCIFSHSLIPLCMVPLVWCHLIIDTGSAVSFQHFNHIFLSFWSATGTRTHEAATSTDMPPADSARLRGNQSPVPTMIVINNISNYYCPCQAPNHATSRHQSTCNCHSGHHSHGNRSFTLFSEVPD